MAKYTKISIGVRKDICAVLIMTDGVLITRRVERIKDEDALKSNFSSLIYAFTLSLRLLRDYIQTTDEEVHAIFEVNNSTFKKWVEQGYTKDIYQTQFIQMIELLNELPLLYDIIITSRTMAYSYTDTKYITKDKVSNLQVSYDTAPDTEEYQGIEDVAIVKTKMGKLSGLDI